MPTIATSLTNTDSDSDSKTVVDPRGWLAPAHLIEVLEALRCAGNESAVHSATTRLGLEVVVSATTRQAERRAHVVTLAGRRSDAAVLAALSAALNSALGVSSQRVVEGAHVTMLFTLGAPEDTALRARAARNALAHGKGGAT